jgi:hypothetical protein
MSAATIHLWHAGRPNMTSTATNTGTPSSATSDIGVGLISVGWMGKLHSRAYQALPSVYPELGLRPRLVHTADRVIASAAGGTWQGVPPVPAATFGREPTSAQEPSHG